MDVRSLVGWLRSRLDVSWLDKLAATGVAFPDGLYVVARPSGAERTVQDTHKLQTAAEEHGPVWLTEDR